jgi:hypothetical protein
VFCSYQFDNSGNNLASQAAYEGSIPFARSNLRREAAEVVRRSFSEGGRPLHGYGWQASLRAAKTARRSISEAGVQPAAAEN